MLLIIHLMLSLIQIPGRGNLLLFRRRLPKGEAFCGKRQALAVFPLFYQAGPPLPRECSGLATPISRRQRSTDYSQVTWERAPLIEQSGRSTVLIPVAAVLPQPADMVQEGASG